MSNFPIELSNTLTPKQNELKDTLNHYISYANFNKILTFKINASLEQINYSFAAKNHLELPDKFQDLIKQVIMNAETLLSKVMNWILQSNFLTNDFASSVFLMVCNYFKFVFLISAHDQQISETLDKKFQIFCVFIGYTFSYINEFENQPNYVNCFNDENINEQKEIQSYNKSIRIKISLIFFEILSKKNARWPHFHNNSEIQPDCNLRQFLIENLEQKEELTLNQNFRDLIENEMQNYQDPNLILFWNNFYSIVKSLGFQNDENNSTNVIILINTMNQCLRVQCQTNFNAKNSKLSHEDYMNYVISYQLVINLDYYYSELFFDLKDTLFLLIIDVVSKKDLLLNNPSKEKLFWKLIETLYNKWPDPNQKEDFQLMFLKLRLLKRGEFMQEKFSSNEKIELRKILDTVAEKSQSNDQLKLIFDIRQFKDSLKNQKCVYENRVNATYYLMIKKKIFLFLYEYPNLDDIFINEAILYLEAIDEDDTKKVNTFGFFFALIKVEILAENFTDYEKNNEKKKVFWHCLEMACEFLINCFTNSFSDQIDYDNNNTNDSCEIIDTVYEIFDLTILLNFFHKHINKKVFRDSLLECNFVKFAYLSLMRVSESNSKLYVHEKMIQFLLTFQTESIVKGKNKAFSLNLDQITKENYFIFIIQSNFDENVSCRKFFDELLKSDSAGLDKDCLFVYHIVLIKYMITVSDKYDFARIMFHFKEALSASECNVEKNTNDIYFLFKILNDVFTQNNRSFSYELLIPFIDLCLRVNNDPSEAKQNDTFIENNITRILYLFYIVLYQNKSKTTDNVDFLPQFLILENMLSKYWGLIVSHFESDPINFVLENQYFEDICFQNAIKGLVDYTYNYIREYGLKNSNTLYFKKMIFLNFKQNIIYFHNEIKFSNLLAKNYLKLHKDRANNLQRYVKTFNITLTDPGLNENTEIFSHEKEILQELSKSFEQNDYITILLIEDIIKNEFTNESCKEKIEFLEKLCNNIILFVLIETNKLETSQESIKPFQIYINDLSLFYKINYDEYELWKNLTFLCTKKCDKPDLFFILTFTLAFQIDTNKLGSTAIMKQLDSLAQSEINMDNVLFCCIKRLDKMKHSFSKISKEDLIKFNDKKVLVLTSFLRNKLREKKINFVHVVKIYLMIIDSCLYKDEIETNSYLDQWNSYIKGYLNFPQQISKKVEESFLKEDLDIVKDELRSVISKFAFKGSLVKKLKQIS